jgi:methionyl-tRNA synthetase
VDGACPEHQVVPDIVEEENYFFRLSRYGNQLAELLDTGALRVVPAWRHQEVRAFVARGLEDFSISRTQARARGWGIAVPGDADVPAALRSGLGDDWDPRRALDAIFAVVNAANRRVEQTKPWLLLRAERDGDGHAGRRLDTTLWELTEALRIVAEALRPLLPDAARRIATQLGQPLAPRWIEALRWGALPGGTRVPAPQPLFPRRQP